MGLTRGLVARRHMGVEDKVAPVKYLFVDGGFLDSMTERAQRYFNLADPLNVNYRFLADGPYARTFYYDAYPAQKVGQSQGDYDSIVQAKHRKFAVLNQTPFIHTREGITRNRTGKGTRLEQKGVDILLAIDVYKHAVQGNMDEAHVVTTDLDFFPLLDVLRETRVSTHLHCYMPETSPDLYHLADTVAPFNYFQILQWSGFGPHTDGLIQQGIRMTSLRDPKTIREGKLQEWPIYLYTDSADEKPYVYGRALVHDADNCIRAEDADHVVQWFEMRHKAPAWF